MFTKLFGQKASRLGGEIFRAKAKKQRIFYTILGLIGFILLNLILFSVSRI